MPAAASPLKAIRPRGAAVPTGRRGAGPAGASTSAAGSSDATRRIADSITAAIVERRLMPGTKLAEQKIADIFAVSRTLVRQALNRLSRENLVTLEPARGARVAAPSIDEARQVFDARRLLESAIVSRAATELGAAQIATLREHLRDEAAAIADRDPPARTRLLTDFHVVLARMLGNPVVAEMLGALVSRSALIALMYQSADSAGHSSAEHVAIVDALERRDARAAVRLTTAHLRHVETDLQLDPQPPDLEAALRPPAAPFPPADRTRHAAPPQRAARTPRPRR